MLPALRLLLAALGVLLLSTPAAQAASKSLPLPAAGQVAATFASGVKGVKVKSAPAGVTVAGAVKRGRLAVAVVRPRGATTTGKVTLTLTGRPRSFKTVAAALDGGKAPDCAALTKLKRLKGTADVTGLGGVLAAKLCGKALPADAAAVLARLGLGAAPAPAPAPPAGPSGGGGRLNPGGTPAAGAKPACANGADDDNDGQADLVDPGCADGNDATENTEVPVPKACLDNGSGVGQGGDPAGLGAGINRCGPFTKVRIDAAPGVAACEIFTGGPGWTCAPSGGYAVAAGPAVDTADVDLTLTGPANCARDVTIALYRPNGEVAELQGPIARCGVKPACSNGKDDDGDGMVDDHFAEGVTDPDPGCSATDDPSENSEIAAPAGCTLSLGTWDDEHLVAGAQTEGCGPIQGFWLRGPGTALGCAYRLADAPSEPCPTVRWTGGTMFGATAQDLRVAVQLDRAVQCEPMTLALILADHRTVAFRARLTGC